VYGTNTFYKQHEPYYSELLHSELPLLHDDNTTKWRIRTGLHEIDFDATDVWDTMDDGGIENRRPFLEPSIALWRRLTYSQQLSLSSADSSPKNHQYGLPSGMLWTVSGSAKTFVS
jgi:hypothetical protein